MDVVIFVSPCSIACLAYRQNVLNEYMSKVKEGKNKNGRRVRKHGRKKGRDGCQAWEEEGKGRMAGKAPLTFFSALCQAFGRPLPSRFAVLSLERPI